MNIDGTSTNLMEVILDNLSICSFKKDFNRNNIDEIISTKISNLPVLKNDTDNVIEFNDGFSNEIKTNKTRSFWDLLKSE